MDAAIITAKSPIKPAAASPVMDQTDWHALGPDAIPLLLDVDPGVGLTPSQVNERQLRYGRNALQRIQSRSAWRVLVDQFASIVIALLAIAAAIAFATGDNAEAIAILIVLALNAAVGFATEGKAD